MDYKVGDVVIIKGRMGSGIRMFFADKIVCLRQHKEKLEALENKKPSN